MIMIEDGNDIPIGILTSMLIYTIYLIILDNLINWLDKSLDNWINNWITFIIYFLPLMILYIEIPIVLKKSNNWQQYFGQLQLSKLSRYFRLREQ